MCFGMRDAKDVAAGGGGVSPFAGLRGSLSWQKTACDAMREGMLISGLGGGTGGEVVINIPVPQGEFEVVS